MLGLDCCFVGGHGGGAHLGRLGDSFLGGSCSCLAGCGGLSCQVILVGILSPFESRDQLADRWDNVTIRYACRNKVTTSDHYWFSDWLVAGALAIMHTLIQEQSPLSERSSCPCRLPASRAYFCSSFHPAYPQPGLSSLLCA